MSKGTPFVSFRLPIDLASEMELVIAGRNSRAFEKPWTRSDFILNAIREKLAHMQRSRERRTKRRKSPK